MRSTFSKYADVMNPATRIHLHLFDENISIYLMKISPFIWWKYLHLFDENISIYLMKISPFIWWKYLHLFYENISIYFMKISLFILWKYLHVFYENISIYFMKISPFILWKYLHLFYENISIYFMKISPFIWWKYLHILCDFDRASSLICGNKMPTRCNRGFYYRFYCLLNMFRAPLCSSSGVQEYYTVVAACGIS